MYINYYVYVFYIPLSIFSNLICLTSSSWFNSWIYMELNLISFICVLNYDYLVGKYNLMIYYIVQAFSSYLFLFGSMIIPFYDFGYILMIFSMFTKLGVPPFYMWYLAMLKNLSWKSNFFLMTLQKMIPMLMINNIINLNLMKFNFLIMGVILLNMFWGSLMGLNQNSIKLIMGFSSIIQVNWMMVLMFFNEKLVFEYYLIYLVITMNLCLIFQKLSLNYLDNLYILKMMNKNKFYFIMLSIMSLAGIPPFFGFLMKLISFQSIYYISFNYLLVMIYSSLISMFFYMRLLYSCMMFYYVTKKNNFKFINYSINFSKSHIILNWMSLIFLFIYEIF